MNSSEPTEVLVVDSGHAPLIRLLLAMASEWESIARDVGELGDSVSRALASTNGRGDIRQFQAFDTIQQRAHGQSHLLGKLSRKIADDQVFDRKRIGDLVADIPFQSVRSNLKAAFEGLKPAEPAGDEDEAAVDWF